MSTPCAPACSNPIPLVRRPAELRHLWPAPGAALRFGGVAKAVAMCALAALLVTSAPGIAATEGEAARRAMDIEAYLPGHPKRALAELPLLLQRADATPSQRRLLLALPFRTASRPTPAPTPIRWDSRPRCSSVARSSLRSATPEPRTHSRGRPAPCYRVRTRPSFCTGAGSRYAEGSGKWTFRLLPATRSP